MAQPSGQSVDPLKIFEQADCFYQALHALCNVQPDNLRLGVMLGEPVMVIGAFTIELFLKCLVCIETGEVPRTHHLRKLFDKLSDSTRARIQLTWNNDISVHRKTEWDRIEAAAGQKAARDLPGALAAASKSFERIRYSYEGTPPTCSIFYRTCRSCWGASSSNLSRSGTRICGGILHHHDLPSAKAEEHLAVTAKGIVKITSVSPPAEFSGLHLPRMPTDRLRDNRCRTAPARRTETLRRSRPPPPEYARRET